MERKDKDVNKLRNGYILQVLTKVDIDEIVGRSEKVI